MASSLAQALRLRDARDNQVAWHLLQAQHAPAIIAILDTHLGGDQRRVPVPDFVNAVDLDLEELAVRGGFELNGSAEYYCEKWRNHGYLVRKPASEGRLETYELSSGAYQAIRFAKGLVEPHHVTTQSRLATIVNQVSSLALDIDGNELRRLQALEEERDRINAQIEDLRQGRYEAVTQAQALERARDIISLAQEIPEDFVRVRDDFEAISRRLHETILNSEEGHADILESVFDGVDHISQSASGQSFNGFYALLRDGDLSETVQDNLDAILENELLGALAPAERRTLHRLLSRFLEQSQEVNEVKTSLSYGLRRFVQSREYLKDRELKRMIDGTLGQAHKVVERMPLVRRPVIELDLSMTGISSISKYALANPAEYRAQPVDVQTEEPVPTLTPEQLRALMRETEIDLEELRENVDIALKQARTRTGNPAAAVSVAEVLAVRPATQGIASVVGLLVLAFDAGRRRAPQESASTKDNIAWEDVSWETARGVTRHARIPTYEFFEEVGK